MTDEMMICARFVRVVKNCKCCFHYAVCNKEGRCVSHLGNLASKVSLDFIPKIKKWLLSISTASRFSLELRNATAEQEANGALLAIGISIQAYLPEKRRNLSGTRRIPVFANDDLETLKEKTFKAYVDIWKGFKNGK